MSSPDDQPGQSKTRGALHRSQNFTGGLFLIAVAALALWLTRDLSKGSLRSMGPAMLPDWLAYGVGACGLILIVSAVLKEREALEAWGLRGPLVVLVSIVAFAVTIRPFSLGPIAIPGLGLVVAGPLAIIISGFATSESRLRPLVVLALSLTPFCMVLFGDLLNLPIPMFPQSFADFFPGGWSQKAILRATAAAMALLALLLFATRRRKRTSKIDVAIEMEEG